MKYADTHEFTSQYEPAIPCVERLVPIREKIKKGIRSLFAPSFDPTRLTRVERREIGIMECEIEWYSALHGPLTK